MSHRLHTLYSPASDSMVLLCYFQEPLKSCLGVEGELFHELMQQANYCQRAAQCNINREEVLQHIKRWIFLIWVLFFTSIITLSVFCKSAHCAILLNTFFFSYIMESNTTPLVLHGPKGCGKSALVAKAFQAIKTWQPEAYKIIRFTGLTPASGTMEQLLLSIISQCSVLAGGEDWHCPHVI